MKLRLKLQAHNDSGDATPGMKLRLKLQVHFIGISCLALEFVIT